MSRSSLNRRSRFELLETRHMMAVFIPGDYNQSGVVDQSDYGVWRAEYGNTIESPADGNGDGIVDAADYVVWRHNPQVQHHILVTLDALMLR
jgi:hypothetical protein